MTVHLFGVASSPGYAKFGLNQIVSEDAADNVQVNTFVTKHFYADDGLTSCPTASQAVKLLTETHNTLSKDCR